MHSTWYKTATIHHNGDYSGPYIFVDILRDDTGEQIGGSKKHIRADLEIETLKEFARHAWNLKDKFVTIYGENEDTGEEDFINVDAEALVDFVVSIKKSEIISEIESMSVEQFLKKYML